MNHFASLVLLGLGCTMVGAQNDGGFSPVGPADKDDVSKCRTMIVSDLKAQETSANSGYKVVVTTSKEKVEKQVVNGINFRFTFTSTVIFKCQCQKCTKKNAKTQMCTATVYKSLDTTQLMTYVPNQGLKCE